MSYLLRHHPEEGSLSPDSAGWIPVNPFMKALHERYPTCTFQDVLEIVQTSDKQRFGLQERRVGIGWIRCNQGHSYPVDLKLTPQIPPEYLYHGTSDRDVVDPISENDYVNTIESIQKHGLSKAQRHHVHLSGDIETAKIVGNRHKGKTVVYTIEAQKMYDEGFVFYVSENGVWLTDHVPPQYLL